MTKKEQGASKTPKKNLRIRNKLKKIDVILAKVDKEEADVIGDMLDDIIYY